MLGELFGFKKNEGNSKVPLATYNGQNLNEKSNIFYNLETAVLRIENCLRNEAFNENFYQSTYNDLIKILKKIEDLGLDETEKKALLSSVYRFIEAANTYFKFRIEKFKNDKYSEKNLVQLSQNVLTKIAKFKGMSIAA